MDREKFQRYLDEIRKEPKFIPSFGVEATTIYGDIPTFMKVPRAYTSTDIKGANVAFMGFPSEGVSYDIHGVYPPDGPESGPASTFHRTGSQYAPECVRRWSMRNSFHRVGAVRDYAIEADIHLLDYLNVVDYGDVACVKGDLVANHAAGRQRVREIVEAGAIPLIQGGDHSVSIPGILGITDCISPTDKVGIIGFDSHLDLQFHEEGLRDWELFSPESQYVRALATPNVEPENIVLIGIKGTGNTESWALVAKRFGIRYFTLKEIDEMGIEKVVEEALERAGKDTKHLYVTLDIDVVDSASCPGQKFPETPGLTPREIIEALRLIGQKRVIGGFDIACLSPQYDIGGATCSLASRCFLEVLIGLATQFKNHNIKNWY